MHTPRQTYTHTQTHTHMHSYINIHIQRYHLGHQNGWYLCLSGRMTLSVVAEKHINDRDRGSLEQCPECWAHTRIRSLTSFTFSHSEQVADLTFSTKKQTSQTHAELDKMRTKPQASSLPRFTTQGEEEQIHPTGNAFLEVLRSYSALWWRCREGVSIHLLSWILLQCFWLQLYVGQWLKERAVETG